MDEELLLTYILYLARKREMAERRKMLRTLRDESDPFSIPESTFFKNFHLQKLICRDLIARLQPFDTQTSSLPFAIRFLSSLYFYAHGSYQKSVGNNFCISMSQPSIFRALQHISQLIVDVFSSQIHFPNTLEELANAKKEFHTSFGMKGTVGAVDCTQIHIMPPAGNDNLYPLYLNSKGYCSINLEAICDHRLMFTFVNAKFPGSCYDADIWKTSEVRMQLMSNHGTQPYTWLLGDHGYPLEPWLMTPVAEPTTLQEKKYNKVHLKAHSTIKRAFRLLRARFKCLSNQRTLYYEHKKASKIIYACCLLHNFIIKYDPTDFVDQDVKDEVKNSNKNTASIESSHFKEGKKIRSYLISTLRSS